MVKAFKKRTVFIVALAVVAVTAFATDTTIKGATTSITVGSSAVELSASVQQDSSGQISQQADSEIVTFNTESLKYHCPSCGWAQHCTRNCIEITRQEAISRGGVPCKICGGMCE